MASQNLNVGTSANSNDGDTLRAAFIKLKQMFAEVYGQTYSEQGDLSGTDFKIKANKLQMTADAVAGDDGKVLTYDHASGSFTWEDAFTGTIGDITGIVAGDGLTGSSLSSDEATINVVAGTGITVAADSVSLATSVQDEISANTLKTGITATQAGHITANNSKVSDQTVTLTDGGNVTITGTYPDFTLSSPDVTGAVTSVNTAVGAVVLDTADIAENTNLYYTEARVAANSAVADNTAKTGITSGQAGEITANTLKVGITTAQAGEITANNDKVTNATHTGDVTGDVALTIADDAVTAAKLDVSNTGADGQILQYNTDGTMTWVTGVTGDITGVATGDGLTGGDTSGDVTISLDTTVAGDGLTLTSGVLDVNVATSQIADDAITSPKLAEFDDTFTAGTTGDIIVSNGTDFIHTTMSGDATIVSGGAITIADNVIDADKLDVVGDGAVGQILTSDGDGSMSWTTGVTGDITSIIATDGLTTPDGTTGDVTIGLAAGVAGDGLTLASGVLSVDTIETGDIADDAVTADKLADSINADILLGVNKVSNVTHTGDVTDASGVLTLVADKVITSTILDANVTTAKIADDAVTYSKLAPEFTDIQVLTGLTVNFSQAAIFTKTITGSETLEFTNALAGQVKTLVILASGASSALAFDTGTNVTVKLNGNYSAVANAKNYIQVQCIDTNNFILTISQAA